MTVAERSESWSHEEMDTGFPSAVREAARRVLRTMPPAGHDPVGAFTVTVAGESLTIPYRIYSPLISPGALAEMDTAERLIAQCLYSRHHDGRVRELAARELVRSAEQFVVPYVVRLLGEYVMEIIAVIVDRLPLEPGTSEAERYGSFVRENPRFVDRTERQMTSYWNCYYRRHYPFLRPPVGSRFDIYPGAAAIDRLRRAAQSGATWPRSPAQANG